MRAWRAVGDAEKRWAAAAGGAPAVSMPWAAAEGGSMVE
jgi:hypothetical protein